MSERGAQALPKRVRLRKRREYLAVQRGGRRYTTSSFVVYVRPNGGRPTRLGMTVSRKVGKAHLRNRVKRWLREAFRRTRQCIPGGLDLVFVVKTEAGPDSYRDVCGQFELATQRVVQGGGQRRSGER